MIAGWSVGRLWNCAVGRAIGGKRYNTDQGDGPGDRTGYGPRGTHSLIDLVALRPDLQTWMLPDRTSIMHAIEVATDLYPWYQQLTDCAVLRHSFTGDLWHLLIGHCGLTLPSS